MTENWIAVFVLWGIISCGFAVVYQVEYHRPSTRLSVTSVVFGLAGIALFSAAILVS